MQVEFGVVDLQQFQLVKDDSVYRTQRACFTACVTVVPPWCLTGSCVGTVDTMTCPAKSDVAELTDYES